VGVGGVLPADEVVEQRALVVVEVGRAGIEQPQFAGQLQHVVRVAALARVGVEVGGDRVRRPEVLGLAVAADHVRVRVDDEVPEVFGDGAVPGGAGGLVLAGGTDRLRHLRVRVEAVEAVLA
jgi:hypothetical protein